MYRTFARYARVYHRASRQYFNVLAPGSTPETVLVAEKHGAAYPVARVNLRPLRWYERLLNR